MRLCSFTSSMCHPTGQCTREIWDEMCQVLKWHNQQGHGCIDTINGPWRKNPFVKNPAQLPQLTPDHLVVVEEEWSLEQLLEFICEARETKSPPQVKALLIVVLRWEGKCYR